VTDSRVKVKLADVARLAGVSISAVSRCFTPGASVSDKTKSLVLKAARELGYQPVSAGKSIGSSPVRMMAVAVSHFKNPFYPLVVENFSRALSQLGYQILLFQTGGDWRVSTDVEETLFRVMDYPVDGLLILNASLSSGEENFLRGLNIPIVMVSRTGVEPGFSAVGADNHEGGRLAAHALVQAGCKRIAYMAGLENTSTQMEREQGFREGLAELGASIHARVVGHYTDEGARHATRVLFSRDRRPDALFAANDLMAIAAIDTLKSEFRLKVPMDVSVVGFDNIPQASWPSYGLTTVDPGVDQMVSESVRLLIELGRAPGIPNQQIRLPVRLVTRSSVRQAK